MDESRVQIHVGGPPDIVPYLDGAGDVLVVDAGRDAVEDWRKILPAWGSSGARRLLVTMPLNTDPRELFSGIDGEFIGCGVVSGRPMIVRRGVEFAHGYWVFGSTPPVSETRSYMPAHVTVGTDRDLDVFHAQFRRYVLQRLVAAHETIVDPAADDGVWTRTAIEVGVGVISLLRNEDLAEDLRQTPMQRFLFDADWQSDEST